MQHNVKIMKNIGMVKMYYLVIIAIIFHIVHNIQTMVNVKDAKMDII